MSRNNPEYEPALPSIDTVAERMSELEKTTQVVEFLHDKEESFQGIDREMIAQAYRELVDRFNDMHMGDPMMPHLPGTRALKEKLNGVPLPGPWDLRPRDFLLGLQEAVPAMVLGQKIKNGTEEKSPENVKRAIGTPSMDTGSKALAVGTAGHLLERSIFAYMKRLGVAQEWEKDEILFALEEMALLMEVEDMNKSALEMNHPWIVDVMTTEKHEDDLLGGLSWRKPEHLFQMVDTYKKVHNIDLFPTEWNEPEKYLPILAPDLAQQMTDEIEKMEQEEMDDRDFILEKLFYLHHYALHMVRFAIGDKPGFRSYHRSEDELYNPKTGEVFTLENLGIDRQKCIGTTTSVAGRERMVAEVTIALYRAVYSS